MNSQREFKLMAFFLALIFCICAGADAQTSTDAALQDTTGTVTGRFALKDGSSIAGCTVLFFNAETGSDPGPSHRRLPDAAKDLDDNGEFTIALPEGKYFVQAIKRLSGKPKMGPPLRGDFIYRKLDKAGKLQPIVIHKGKTLDIGTIYFNTTYKEEDYIEESIHREKLTAIEGRVFSEDGKPVENAIVFVFITPQALGKPLFVSEKTGKDGKYLVQLSAGNYYLKVRSVYGGGTPAEGELMGFYGKESPQTVLVKTGEITGNIDINTVIFKRRPNNPNNQK